jgi:hypothetical protein
LEPVERTRIEPRTGRGNVGLVRREQLAAPLAQEPGREDERLLDRRLVEERQSGDRGRGLALDERDQALCRPCSDGRFTLYCDCRGRACPLRIKRG